MINWIKQLFQAPDGLPDDGRVAAFMLVLSYIVYAGWSVIYQGKAFDPQQYGVGIGAMLAGTGVLFGQRKGN